MEPVEGQEMTARSAKGIYLKEQQLVDGEMQTVREGFFPEDEADLLLKQYGSGIVPDGTCTGAIMLIHGWNKNTV